ncbi:hypothetical protein [Microbulbifer yueqingensis]|uniref:Uncharacterized protein n=1 Tax=Microbulbifer yueqingensis TaxID=658219 RepID=A0A1G9BG32_9GAMM|nr:hypothetical protein [Microbulbifer yueqingensis]SDK38160.1 hypothetical protein SAMN05216212_2221 [Microbulbifer yueqingensis]
MKRITMNGILLAFALSPSLGLSDDLKDVYWSTHACDGYIYHFDNADGEFRIYTRLDVEDKKRGEYKSYQLTEGKLEKVDVARYRLSGESISGTLSIDSAEMQQATMESTQFGSAPLIRCDAIKAKQLISEADKHFESCPKNVLNCKSS